VALDERGGIEGTRRGRAALVVALGAYGGVTVFSGLVAWALGLHPFETTAWISGAESMRVASAIMSVGFGAVVGAGTLAATRVLMRRAAWARALHADLRPVVQGADDATIAVIALASGIGEEILFRGLLVPAVGVIASSLLFGVVHQVRGRARWGWMAWAALTGLLFALIFRLTGSLLGPIVAHVAINAVNLRRLRDAAPQPPPQRRLGGLLGRART